MAGASAGREHGHGSILPYGGHTTVNPENNTCLLDWRLQRQRLQQNLQQTACRSLHSMSDRELDERLGHLCNDLVDYLSTGHSRIYVRYFRIDRRADSVAGERNRLLQDIWHNLGRTTDAALRFNQRCESAPMEALQEKLHGELGKLGKMLSLRFALEEQLLELAADGPASRGECGP